MKLTPDRPDLLVAIPGAARACHERRDMTSKLSPSDATALVESYRVKLGFLPWHEHEQAARNKYDPVGGRRSGRTTHTILCALARATAFPDERVVLRADPSFVAYCRNMLRGYAARLDVDASRIEVVSHDWKPSYTSQDRSIKWTFFADHYDAKREQIQARFRRR